jgi:predicted dehydrogenase
VVARLSPVAALSSCAVRPPGLRAIALRTDAARATDWSLGLTAGRGATIDSELAISETPYHHLNTAPDLSGRGQKAAPEHAVGGPRRLRDGPITVGFVGAGNVLPAYLQALDRLVARGLALCGPVVARSERARARLSELRPGAGTVPDVDALLSDESVELVVVVTPPASHPELVRTLLAAGRHVVCEKPLARDPATAAELFRAAENAGRLLLAAPFVQLNPTFRRLWTLVDAGALGHVHAARAHYGNAGSTWARWYHDDPLATLGDIAIYNLKSLCSLLGSVTEVVAVAGTALSHRSAEGAAYRARHPDTWQLLLRHERGTLASVLASHATLRYRRPALELYGTTGTANLLGDDWDPHGLEVWRQQRGAWELYEPDDPTWLWTDGLREAVAALHDGRAPLASADLDVHVLEVIEAAARSATERVPAAVASRVEPLAALRLAELDRARYVHDRTRPADEQ